MQKTFHVQPFVAPDEIVDIARSQWQIYQLHS